MQRVNAYLEKPEFAGDLPILHGNDSVTESITPTNLIVYEGFAWRNQKNLILVLIAYK